MDRYSTQGSNYCYQLLTSQSSAESRSFPTFQSQLLEQKRGTDGSGQALSLYDIVNVSGYYQEISQQIVSTKAIVINTPIISSKTNQIRVPSIGTNRSTENESVHEKDVQIPSKPLGYVPTFDMAYIQRKLNEEHERADSSLVGMLCNAFLYQSLFCYQFVVIRLDILILEQ